MLGSARQSRLVEGQPREASAIEMAKPTAALDGAGSEFVERHGLTTAYCGLPHCHWTGWRRCAIGRKKPRASAFRRGCHPRISSSALSVCSRKPATFQPTYLLQDSVHLPKSVCSYQRHNGGNRVQERHFQIPVAIRSSPFIARRDTRPGSCARPQHGQMQFETHLAHWEPRTSL